MDPSLKLLIRLPRSGRSRGRGRSVGATAFVAGFPRPAYLAASLFGAVSLDALSGRGGTQALRRWLGEFSEGDQNNEDPEWWVRDSGYRLPFYSDLEKEAEGDVGDSADDDDPDMPPKAAPKPKAVPLGVRPKRWGRIYAKLSRRHGVILLLVEPVRVVPGDTRWVVVDPTRRLQVIDLINREMYRGRPEPGIEYGEFEGLTSREKSKAVDLATTIASAENPDGKTAQVPRDPPRGGRAKGARRGSFLWDWGCSLVTGASLVFTFMRAGWTMGGVATGSFLVWRVARALNLWGWMEAAYATAKAMATTADNFAEFYEEVRDAYESGRMDIPILVLSILLFILWLGYVRPWQSSAAASAEAPSSASAVAFSAQPPSAGSSVASSPRDSGAALSEEEAGSEHDVEKLMAQIGELTKRLDAADERPPTPPPPAPANEPVPLEAAVDSFMKRLEDHEKLVGMDKPGATGAAAWRPTASSTGATTGSSSSGLAESFESSFKDIRESALEKLRAFTDTKITIAGEPRARVAGEFCSKTYRDGQTAQQRAEKFLRSKQLEGHHLAHEIQLLAMVFDRGVREAPREWLNLESTEFLARRLYGMERAFSEVRKESDWKPPKDKQKGFKSKVQWHFLEECDPRMLEASDLHVASVDKEIRERLTERGKLLKSLSSLESGDKDKDQ